MSFDLISIGDTTLDTFLILDENNKNIHLDQAHRWLSIQYGEKTAIKDTAQSIGGNAANVAVGAKKLGLQVALVSELGDDLNGHTILNELEQQHVDTTLVKLLPKKETRYSIVLNYQGERTILAYHAPRSYSLPKLPTATWIYYTSLGASFERLQKNLEQHLEKHTETTLVLNPGSFQLKEGLDHLRRILARTTVLFVNKEEAALIVGARQRIPKLLRSLERLGPKIVVITDSVRGSYIRAEHTNYHMAPYPVKVVAKTGAGDAYASGFLSALAQGKTPPEAMQWGTANSAGVIQQHGAQKGLLTKTQILALQKKFPSITPTKLRW